MDDPGMRKADDQSAEGKDVSSDPVENKKDSPAQRQQDEVVKPPGTSYPVIGK
jgi:hypothetical protein